jgi:hypothetical protein
VAAILHELALETAVVAALAANFNAEIEASSGVYGLVPVALDFSESSKNFVREQIKPHDVELSELLEFPAGCVYMGESEDSGQPRGVRFAGGVMVHVDFYWRNREGSKGREASRRIKQFNDAVLASFAAHRWPTENGITIIYTRRTASTPEHQIPLADGEGQALSIKAQFGVQVT